MNICITQTIHNVGCISVPEEDYKYLHNPENPLSSHRQYLISIPAVQYRVYSILTIYDIYTAVQYRVYSVLTIYDIYTCSTVQGVQCTDNILYL